MPIKPMAIEGGFEPIKPICHEWWDKFGFVGGSGGEGVCIKEWM